MLIYVGVDVGDEHVVGVVVDSVDMMFVVVVDYMMLMVDNYGGDGGDGVVCYCYSCY